MVSHRGRYARRSSRQSRRGTFSTPEGARRGWSLAAVSIRASRLGTAGVGGLAGLSAGCSFSRPQGHASGGGAIIISIVIIKNCSHPGSCGLRLLGI